MEKGGYVIYQFTTLGNRCDLKLHVSGVAACSGEKPIYLRQATFVLDNSQSSDRPHATIDRDIATAYIDELSRYKGSVNDAEGRELAQLEALELRESHPYWLNFEQFRRYVHTDLSDKLKVTSDGELTMALLLAQAVILYKMK